MIWDFGMIFGCFWDDLGGQLSQVGIDIFWRCWVGFARNVVLSRWRSVCLCVLVCLWGSPKQDEASAGRRRPKKTTKTDITRTVFGICQNMKTFAGRWEFCRNSRSIPTILLQHSLLECGKQHGFGGPFQTEKTSTDPRGRDWAVVKNSEVLARCLGSWEICAGLQWRFIQYQPPALLWEFYRTLGDTTMEMLGKRWKVWRNERVFWLGSCFFFLVGCKYFKASDTRPFAIWTEDGTLGTFFNHHAWILLEHLPISEVGLVKHECFQAQFFRASSVSRRDLLGRRHC